MFIIISNLNMNVLPAHNIMNSWPSCIQVFLSYATLDDNALTAGGASTLTVLCSILFFRKLFRSLRSETSDLKTTRKPPLAKNSVTHGL